MPKRYRVEYVLIDDESFDDAENNLSLDYIKEIAVPSHLDAGVSVDSVSVTEITTTPPDFTEQAQQLIREFNRKRKGHLMGDCAGELCPDWQEEQVTMLNAFASEAATQGQAAMVEQAVQEIKQWVAIAAGTKKERQTREFYVAECLRILSKLSPDSSYLNQVHNEAATRVEELERQLAEANANFATWYGRALATAQECQRLNVELTELRSLKNNLLSEASTAAQWQPIEAAPRDGPLLLFGPSLIDEDYNPNGVVEGWHNGEEWLGAIWNNEQDCYDLLRIEPTHWMLLQPPPPIAAIGDDKEQR